MWICWREGQYCMIFHKDKIYLGGGRELSHWRAGRRRRIMATNSDPLALVQFIECVMAKHSLLPSSTVSIANCSETSKQPV